jgi:hypothetical protein
MTGIWGIPETRPPGPDDPGNRILAVQAFHRVSALDVISRILSP